MWESKQKRHSITDAVFCFYAQVLHYRFHCGHVGAEFAADYFNRVIADFSVDLNELGIVYAVVFNVETFADNVGVKLGHEVFCHHRSGNAAKEVATVFCGVGDDAVHFVEAFAVNQVCNQRNFVQ